MILDTGICKVYRKTNVAGAGAKPVYQDTLIAEGWYGELNFETAPVRPAGPRENVRTDTRVRILQNRQINNHDRVLLSAEDGVVYEVTRAYHGTDADNGEPITDLSLEVVTP
jgi:hypothetical protein